MSGVSVIDSFMGIQVLPGIIGFKELLEFDRGGFWSKAIDKDGIVMLFLQLIWPMDMDFLNEIKGGGSGEYNQKGNVSYLTKDDSPIHSMQGLFGTSSFMEFNESRLIKSLKKKVHV